MVTCPTEPKCAVQHCRNTAERASVENVCYVCGRPLCGNIVLRQRWTGAPAALSVIKRLLLLVGFVIIMWDVHASLDVEPAVPSVGQALRAVLFHRAEAGPLYWVVAVLTFLVAFAVVESGLRISHSPPLALLGALAFIVVLFLAPLWGLAAVLLLVIVLMLLKATGVRLRSPWRAQRACGWEVLSRDFAEDPAAPRQTDAEPGGRDAMDHAGPHAAATTERRPAVPLVVLGLIAAGLLLALVSRLRPPQAVEPFISYLGIRALLIGGVLLGVRLAWPSRKGLTSRVRSSLGSPAVVCDVCVGTSPRRTKWTRSVLDMMFFALPELSRQVWRDLRGHDQHSRRDDAVADRASS
ncbi:MAG: hypothetical protein AMS14_02370 [Planctomycetes bacterium DG_20]|nr:MAG: hypothetical protein AMS14_02370 [Planctomycetes bacterium DG_20]